MSEPPSSVLVERLRAARVGVVQEGWDALLVTAPSNFRYVTGLDTSAGMALVHTDGLDVILDGRYVGAAQDALAGRADVELLQVPAGRSYEETAAARISARGWASVAAESGHMTLARLGGLRRALGGGLEVRWAEADDLIERLRAVKDPWEQAVLREAGVRLAQVATCILPLVSAGRTERDVAWSIAAALHDGGFDRPAFETIVASGPHAARPHHRPTDRRLTEADLVVVDFGGVLQGYSVDMTRTVCLSGSDAHLGWIAAVGHAQTAAFEASVPGARPSDVDGAARRALQAAALDTYFTHSTGHGLGLDIHERPTIGPRGDASGPLVPGMVFTIEPGVYIPGDGGVRIEDDVLLTEAGATWLTKAPGTLHP